MVPHVGLRTGSTCVLVVSVVGPVVVVVVGLPVRGRLVRDVPGLPRQTRADAEAT